MREFAHDIAATGVTTLTWDVRHGRSTARRARFSDRVRHGNPVNADAYGLSWPQTLQFIRTTTA